MYTIIFGQMVDYFTDFQKGLINKDQFTHKVSFGAMYFLYLAIVMFITTYIFMAVWVYTGERLARQIRERYLRAILRQNIAYFDRLGAGEVTARITSDTHLIQDGISEKVGMAFAVCIKNELKYPQNKSSKLSLFFKKIIVRCSIFIDLCNSFCKIMENDFNNLRFNPIGFHNEYNIK